MIYSYRDLLNVPVDGRPGSWQWSAVPISAKQRSARTLYLAHGHISPECVRFASFPACSGLPPALWPRYLFLGTSGPLDPSLPLVNPIPLSVCLTVSLSFYASASLDLYLFSLCLSFGLFDFLPSTLLLLSFCPFSYPSFCPTHSCLSVVPCRVKLATALLLPTPVVYILGNNTQPCLSFSHP
ncbi:hypothetical protein HJG60_008993 [Phyllostomus discolor]|uniref:Uncharacterized protein n=1 Tax=Phyllostomus discolor TaxID=89673 RepID=A0A833YP87_9CHIR|nr:hypothetical protein HJG60_008993 [Phyllostomus discolor]